MPTSAFPFAPGRLHQSITVGELYEGNIAQDFFRDRAWEYAKSSPRDNWSNHFDYIVKKDGRSFNVEIKSPKKCRVPGTKDEGLVLLEHTGITGKPGWLQGRADFILQFFSETKVLCYHREQALQAYGSVPPTVTRCNPTNAPIQEWFGREGMSRKGTVNQDVIRWEPLNIFCDQVSRHNFYSKINNKWQRQ
jgi:hypothetical protein